MDLRNVLFIGGDRLRLASVQVRCVDIATRLGCALQFGRFALSQIPEHFTVFVCVKPILWPGQLKKLAQRGTVIWDIIDAEPPKEYISIYLASTKSAQRMFFSLGRVELIPHHHCNVSGQPNGPELRHPGWVGSRHWHPSITGFNYNYYDTIGLTRDTTAEIYRKIGIGLNLRSRNPEASVQWRKKPLHDFHIAMNSGIKLINCMGFGIPSISDNEPAYHEAGEDCTIFSTLDECAHWVQVLQTDDVLYHRLRENCLCRAPLFHLDTIADRYRSLLHSL